MLLDDLDYDDKGRLVSWRTPESRLEFSGHDPEGRPAGTKQIRLRADGTAIDEYSQSHSWDGFGRRTSWSMPGGGALTAGWTSLVQQQYDAAGNLIHLDRSGAGGASTLLTADYRAPGRPKHRTLNTAAGVELRYTYSGLGRMIGRRVEIANAAGTTVPADSAFRLATPLELGPDAGLPPETTFVWDPIADRMVAIFDTATGQPLRQFLHGGMGLDDPVEVTVAEAGGPARYYPIFDEAGDGGLQAILDQSGKIVTRTIMDDPYGDGEIALSGAAVEKVTVTKTDAAGVNVDVTLTEPIDSATLAAGVRLTALTNANPPAVAATTAVIPALAGDGRLVRWSLSAAEWTALATAPGAHSLSIAVTDALRATTYTSAAPVMPANTTLRSGVYASAAVPFELRESFTQLATRLSTTTPYDAYELTSLTSTSPTAFGSAGATLSTNAADSGASLLMVASFQAQSFTDPLTLKNYVRNRWYDPQTGTFLSPDPEGYGDSSNLYAFAGGDPVNGRDPLGLRKATAADAATRQTMATALQQLDAQWKQKKQVTFVRERRVSVQREWWDTSGIPGEYDVAYELVNSGYWGDYQEARQKLQAQIQSFDAAVAEADPDGVISYFPGHGFVTETSAEASSRRWANAWLAPVAVTNALALVRTPYYARAVGRGWPLPSAMRYATPDEQLINRLLSDEASKLRAGSGARGSGVRKDAVIAAALLRVGRNLRMLRAVSGATKGAGCIDGECTEFETLPSGANLRRLDAEAKLLNGLAKQLNRNDVGRVDLYIEQIPCPSCDGVIQQFMERFPNVQVVIHLNPFE